MKQTKGVEVAIFLYETDYMEYKVSLRSENIVDVSKVASYFGGGGQDVYKRQQESPDAPVHRMSGNEK